MGGTRVDCLVQVFLYVIHHHVEGDYWLGRVFAGVRDSPANAALAMPNEAVVPLIAGGRDFQVEKLSVRLSLCLGVYATYLEMNDGVGREFQFSCIVAADRLHWCVAEFLVVAAAGLDVPDRLHLAVAQADETVPAAYHSVLLGWNQH